MDEYWAIVDPRDTQVTFTVKYREEGVVDVALSNGVRFTCELVFPTTEKRDAFLISRRFRRDAERCGGRMTIVTPQSLLESMYCAQNDTEQGTVQLLSSGEVGPLLGVPGDIIYSINREAWVVVLHELRTRLSRKS